MSKFEESRWTNSKFSQNYIDKANIYLPFRREFIEITKSLYAYFFDAKSENNVLKGVEIDHLNLIKSDIFSVC